MHPSIIEILQVLADNKLRYTISTNASKYIDLDKNLLKICRIYLYLFRGFSQESYDQIHGFEFEKILENINKWIELVGPERIQIQYHIYQFNLNEIETSSAYFKQKGVKFYPYCAYFADYELSRSYLNDKLPDNLLEKASKELILSYVDDYIASLPKDYTCPQGNILTIDEYCNVLTCCLLSKADPDYSIGSLFSLSKDEIKQKKEDQKTCRECIEMGIAYWVHNVYCPDFVQKYNK